MIANIITLACLLFTFGVMSSHSSGGTVPGITLLYAIAVIFFLDSYIVYKPNQTSESREVQTLKLNTASWIK